MVEISDKLKLKRLKNYYSEKGLLIIGLNDSQGVNVTSAFFKKGLLEYIANALTNEKTKPAVINAFSLTMNKTEHIDYFLYNNISLEEIKLSQIYSAVSAFEKVMTDLNLPRWLGKTGYIYKKVYKKEANDRNIKLADSIKYVPEPTIIYSSGVNNLMREVGANPYSIKKIYKERFETPNYFYTLSKSKDLRVLNKVIDSIEKNYYNILSINDKADIYTLGAYVPKSLKNEDMDVFRDLICRYNERLIMLCNKYNITFIDTETIGKKYANKEIGFHISGAGHNVLANTILGYMYKRKFESNIKNLDINFEKLELMNKGAKGIIELCRYDYEECIINAQNEMGFGQQRQIQIATEHRREQEVFEKVLRNKR